MNGGRVCRLIAARSVAVLLISCDTGTDADPIAERRECLVGSWTMLTADLDLLVSTVVPVPGIRVPEGLLHIFFDADGGFTYMGTLIIHIDMDATGSSYLEGDGAFRTTGRYAIDGDTIRFDYTDSETEVFVWRAYKDGRSAEAPGGGPTFDVNLPAVAPYRCTASSLEIDTVGPAGTVTMFFER